MHEIANAFRGVRVSFTRLFQATYDDRFGWHLRVPPLFFVENFIITSIFVAAVEDSLDVGHSIAV